MRDFAHAVAGLIFFGTPVIVIGLIILCFGGMFK